MFATSHTRIDIASTLRASSYHHLLESLHMDNTIASGRLAGTRDYAAIVLPVAIWLLAVLFAHPYGNFPLDDDWSYSQTVRHLLETGQYRPLDWTSMTLIGQAYWGALFSLPFGFSFSALRVSTLAAGALGVFAFSMLLQENGCTRRQTLIATLVAAFNPMYLVLAGTFMTDVSFTALCVACALFFSRYVSGRQLSALIAALLFSIAALSVRQLAMFLPLAMLLALLLEPRRRWLPITLCGLTIVVSWVLIKAFEAWLRARHAIPVEYSSPIDTLRSHTPPLAVLLVKSEQAIRFAIDQLGWFLFPLLIWRAPSVVRHYAASRWGKAALAAAALCGTAWFALMVATHHMLPMNWTTIHAGGAGPIWLRDSKFVPDVPPLPALFWAFITLIGVAGGMLLLLDLLRVVASFVATWRAGRTSPSSTLRAFLFLASAIYMAPFLLLGFFDRYLLPPTFLLCALLVFELKDDASVLRMRAPLHRFISTASLCTLIVTSAFSIASLHDYLSWNRARWLLIDTLLQRGVTVDHIDGGYEFNGLYLYQPHYDYAHSGDRSWWTRDEQYVIQFTPLAGYSIVDSADAGGWLPSLNRRILTLERNPH